MEGPGCIYLTGGASALLNGWRTSTIDIEIKPAPEPGRFFESIALLKEQLDIYVELAAPDQFIPALPGWQGRSIFIAHHGLVDYYHYDFYSQALAQIERGHRRDVTDVEAMTRAGLIFTSRLWELFCAIEPDLLRYPAITPRVFRSAVEAFCTADHTP